MKKIVLSMATLAALSFTAFAGEVESGFQYTVNAGKTFADYEGANGNKFSDDGYEFGVAVSHPIQAVENLSFAVGATVAIGQSDTESARSNRYMLDVLAKYEVMKNLKLGAGVDYTYLDPEVAAGQNFYGWAAVGMAEYEIANKIGVYAKYLNGSVENKNNYELDREDITIGLTYRF